MKKCVAAMAAFLVLSGTMSGLRADDETADVGGNLNVATGRVNGSGTYLRLNGEGAHSFSKLGDGPNIYVVGHMGMTMNLADNGKEALPNANGSLELLIGQIFNGKTDDYGGMYLSGNFDRNKGLGRDGEAFGAIGARYAQGRMSVYQAGFQLEAGKEWRNDEDVKIFGRARLTAELMPCPLRFNRDRTAMCVKFGGMARGGAQYEGGLGGELSGTTGIYLKHRVADGSAKLINSVEVGGEVQGAVYSDLGDGSGKATQTMFGVTVR